MDAVTFAAAGSSLIRNRALPVAVGVNRGSQGAEMESLLRLRFSSGPVASRPLLPRKYPTKPKLVLCPSPRACRGGESSRSCDLRLGESPTKNGLE